MSHRGICLWCQKPIWMGQPYWKCIFGIVHDNGTCEEEMEKWVWDEWNLQRKVGEI